MRTGFVCDDMLDVLGDIQRHIMTLCHEFCTATMKLSIL